MCSANVFAAVLFLSAVQPSSGFWLFNVVFPPNATSVGVQSNDTPPLIIVPGNLGNRLEAKIDKPTLVHWMCYKKTDWFSLWIDLNMFMPIGIDCWIDNFKLHYNRTTRQSSNSIGVDVRVPGFGKTHPIEFLDTNRLAGYFHTLVQFLVNMGYVRDKTIQGAPYDWRRAPNENGEYLSKLKKLVEEMYDTYQQPVQLLGHSMGCHYVLYFLNQQTQAWKDKYIKGFLSLAAPWGGAIKVLRVMSSGDNDGIPLIPNNKIREIQRMASSPWMLPFLDVWPKDHVFISTPNATYTNQDYKQYFSDIDYDDGWHIWQDTKNLTFALQPPGVEVWCMYGVGMPTPVTYIYDDKYPDSDPVDYVYADGDDTVDSLSMSQCKRWIGQQEQPVHVTEFRGMPHLDMVFHYKVLGLMQQILEGKSDAPEEIDCRIEKKNKTQTKP